MVEILYRIYEVADGDIPENEQALGLLSLSKQFSREIAMDCLICESRNAFKEIIKDTYGNDIKFAYNRKYPAGTIYCIIIGEHCYNVEQYFNKTEFICSNCGCKTTAYAGKAIYLSDYEIRNALCNQLEKYQNARFCSNSCLMMFLNRERKKCMDNGDVDESFISRETFSFMNVAGYIYKITKKSTGEFYVGQTKYVPIFRWGQHLKTDRFDIRGILDYQFEVLEIVDTSHNILEREKYWIQKLYKECPEKSLNIACTANVVTNNQISLFKKEQEVN